jgi:hypothetical protein
MASAVGDPEGTNSVLNDWTTLGAGCSDEDFRGETEQITAIPKPCYMLYSLDSTGPENGGSVVETPIK